MKKFEIIKSTKNNKTFFGLIITADDKEYSFPFISESRNDVEKIADNFKNNDISPVHYNEIISDYFIGKAYDSLIENALT